MNPILVKLGGIDENNLDYWGEHLSLLKLVRYLFKEYSELEFPKSYFAPTYIK